MIEDQVYFIHGSWRAILGGEPIPAEWNSKGAAEAGLQVERRRRKLEGDGKGCAEHPNGICERCTES